MTFYIYSRKSVSTGKGESIGNQIEMCRQYIAAHFPEDAARNLVIYEDEGFSAKNTDRPQFQKMLRDLRQNRPDYLVCYRLDRISRSVSDFSALIENLNQSGISFICIREEFDTSRPMGKAMMYIASVFAQLERETIAERVRDNMRMLARSGRWLGGTTPTGYCAAKIRETLPDGNVRSHSILRENEAELADVRAIYTGYSQCGSLSGTCGALTARGLLSRSGKPYSPAVIRQILKNPVYCTADAEAHSYFTRKGADVCFAETDFPLRRGLLAYNKRDCKKENVPRLPVSEWIVAPGRHTGLIPGAQWVAVQLLLGEERRLPRHSDSLLSGLLFCGKCGSILYAKSRNGSTSSFDYICRSKLRQGAAACACPNLNGPAADRAALEAFAALPEDRVWLRKGLEKLLRKLPVCHPESDGSAREAAITLLNPAQCVAALPVREQRRLLRVFYQNCIWDGEQLHLYCKMNGSGPAGIP